MTDSSPRQYALAPMHDFGPDDFGSATTPTSAHLGAESPVDRDVTEAVPINGEEQ